MDNEREINEKKIEKTKVHVKDCDAEIEKKTEEIKEASVNVNKIETGGHVEDQVQTLKNALQTGKNNLNNVIAKKKRIQDEINRDKKALEQGK